MTLDEYKEAIVVLMAKFEEDKAALDGVLTSSDWFQQRLSLTTKLRDDVDALYHQLCEEDQLMIYLKNKKPE